VAIRHSLLERASRTARIIAETLGGGVPLFADEDLRELNHGAWEGSTHGDVRDRYPVEYAAWRADPSRAQAPGGESLAAASERAARALARSLDDLGAGDTAMPGAWAIVVAHDGLLRLMLLRALGFDPIGPGFWAFPFDSCAITVVELANGTAALRCHNAGEHLDLG
jgi:probable phosphoglycerate mutase